jgi:photosystem II stability/assembly factor-like uncharacterized protein
MVLMRGCFAFLAFSAAFAAHSQDFIKVAPLPTGANLNAVEFTSASTGFIVGEGHEFYKTSNGGLTWNRVALPGYPDGPLYNITFVNQSVGFIAGNSAQGSIDIFRTLDGGASWHNVQSFPLGGSWYHIDFVNQNVGFMGSNGAIVRTMDGGQSWILRSWYPNCPVIFGMDFISADVGLVGGLMAGGSDEGIFKTTNGGQIWRLKYPHAVNDVIYLTNDVVLSIDGIETIKSIDGGDTWQQTFGQVPTGLFDMEKIDETTVVGVSGAGDVWKTSDGGFSWRQTLVGEGDLPASWYINFRDTLNGHVVGQSGAIFSSGDGGETWVRMNKGISRDWNALAAFSNGEVVLAGHHGYVQKTANAGVSWTPQLLDPPTFGRDTSFSDIDVTSENEAVAVGHWGGLFKTFDRGENWLNLNGAFSIDYYPNAVEFVDANNGWVVGWDYTPGDKKYVQRTFDGGFTWQVAPQVNVPAQDVQFRGQLGWILSGEFIRRTTNGGNAWTLGQLPLNEGSPPSTSQLSFGTDSVGYVVGWDGYIAKTTNGAASWTRIGPNLPGTVYLGVFASGPNEVWICGAQSGGGAAVVRRSLDGGQTWRIWSLPGQYTTPYRMLKTAGFMYVCGYAGSVWKLPLTQRRRSDG